jgi:hypothetical protein
MFFEARIPSFINRYGSGIDQAIDLKNRSFDTREICQKVIAFQFSWLKATIATIAHKKHIQYWKSSS